MGRNRSRPFTQPETQVLHLIVDKAEELGRIAEITPLLIGWYTELVARGEAGHVNPEVPHAQK